jgi:hypothetical protein
MYLFYFSRLLTITSIFLGIITTNFELSSLARTLESWDRIPLKAWVFGVCMHLFCVYVLLCVGSGLATG